MMVRATWLRVLLVIAAASFVSGVAWGQAPPAAFYEGRSNDELRGLARDRHNDILLRRGAATKLVMTLADAGDLDEADAAGREFATNIDPRALSYAVAMRRRGYVHTVAAGALAIILVVASFFVVAARRSLPRAVGAVRRSLPVILLFVANMGLVGGYLASTYENASPLPFLWFAACALPLMVIFRTWSAVGSPRLVARAGRAVLGASAALALGFLVVEHVNPSYLAGLGL